MVERFEVVLTADQEIDPIPTKAFGEGTVYWSEETGLLLYKLDVDGIDFTSVGGVGKGTSATGDDVILFHFHNAPRGEAGPVVFDATNTPDPFDLVAFETRDGSWVVGGVVDTGEYPALVAQLRDAEDAKPGEDVAIYFNIHTVQAPDGEIRGQWVAAEDWHY